MITHLYRFRSLKRLLDENEFRNQEIFFAEPESLNDPMEGFRDVFWKGDGIVWQNLFRHYITCLEWAYSMLSIGGEREPIGWSEAVFSGGDTGTTEIYHAHLEKLVRAFVGREVIQLHVQALAKRTLPIRRDELAAYLQHIHFFALSLIRQNYQEHGLATPQVDSPEIQERLQRLMGHASRVAPRHDRRTQFHSSIQRKHRSNPGK